jgi:hypothetical protein
VDAVFGALAFLERFLGEFLVLPEVGLAYLRFETREEFLAARDVKGSSARDRCAFSGLRSDVPNLLRSSRP